MVGESEYKGLGRGFRVSGIRSGFRVGYKGCKGSRFSQGLRFTVLGSEFRVEGVRCKVFRVQRCR
jgi:opacity protein-like surface antigen